MKCCLVSSDVSWHIRDKLWLMPKHGSINLTSTETRRLVRTDSPGRLPRLSHSSWTQIKQGAAFIAANKVYTSANKSTIVWIETELFFSFFFLSSFSFVTRGGCVSCLLMMKCCLVSPDVSWHIRDKLWPMPKHGSINLYVHGNQKAR